MKKPVLVLGGGIAGIQASLDLAEMNIPVFLVESSPSIGGRMAQLDKTFPTNDCSACILAPKVTSCYSHPLVKTFTWSELIDIKGEAPNFTAVIRKKARFIDEDLCRGCNACTLKCPVTVKSEFEMGMGDRRAVFKPFAQAVPNIVTIDKKGTAPCKYQCPAHMDVNGYVVLAGQGRFEEALQLIRRTTPFAGVLGRVCAEDCKANCYRRHVDEPLALGALKRFIADYELEQGKSPKLAKGKAKETKVAVIGSGPAGLNCAYQLALMGYQVTVFEALPVPGGMLRTAIPAYRLDRKVLDREIALVQSLGVEIRCNSPVGKELTLDDLRQQGYKAFFLATGAQKEKRVGIPGETLADVISCREFLQDLNLTGHEKPGRKVVVIGGGYGALDAARSALRLGSEATVLYSGKEEDMAATPTELAQAKEEGVRVEILTSPVEILGDNGHAVGVKCRSGITGQEWIVPADTVIIDNAMVGDVENFDINEPDVFVGGAAVTGIGSVIQAIAEGNRAAKRIYNYLEGANMDVEPFVMEQTPVEAVKFPVVSDGGSCEIPTLDREQRIRSFAEVELGIQSPEEAQAEAQRCLNCSVCAECRACEKVCPPKAIRHEQRDEIIAVEVSSVIMAAGYDPVSEIPDEFGYSRSANVVTSMEYERILSASGPYQGHVRRPSDGRVPQRIAFIQCVGSRDEKCDASYCSAVCCMYAVKEAIITREHLPQVKDIDIFYMDMRAYGKDFDKYVDSAQNAHGVRFVKSRVAEVVENPETGGLIIKHCGEDGRMTSSEYDMVVLSVGLRPKPEVQDLLAKSGVKTNRFDFNWVHEMKAPATSREGIFACGVSAGPKDIPETVMEASAAASMASRAAGMTEVSLKDYAEYFKEEEEGVIRDVSNQPIRIGVFVCHCGTNIAGFLDVKEVARYARSLPFVVFSRDYLYACSVDTQKTIADTIKRLQLNRVVIASCTPRTHEPLFQQVLVKAGLNPYLVTMANIRDQCSWVHMQEYEEATEKAKDLVRMAVGKVTFAKPLTRQKVGVNKEALVIGGGMAGMTAALEIAGMGYKTYLVEREGRLGGYGARLASSPTGKILSRLCGRRQWRMS
ncbi:MAG: FAD-dependent oxidoreductase [Clostridia bacterium]